MPVEVPFLFLPSLGIGELSIIFVIILIVFGPGKLPGVMKSLGDGVRQFKDASKDLTAETTTEGKSESSSSL